MVEGWLWKWGISLYGHSVNGTWREGSFTGDPEGYVQEGSGDGHCSIGALLGNLEGGSFIMDFERWMRWGPIGGNGEGGGAVDPGTCEFAAGRLWL